MAYLYDIMALLEAPNYVGMFNDFIAAKDARNDPTPIIEKYIKWARQTLKKNDRIVWFLRFVRVELAGQLRHADSDAELARLNRKLGTHYSRHDLIPVTNLSNTLAHYLSMPVPEIQQVIWGKQSPIDLTTEFSQLEATAREASDDDSGADEMYRQRRLLPRSDRDQVIIRCPDGLCWVDLETHVCRHEAGAMGHCGNGAGRVSDNILSLRKPITFRGQPYWYPICTFIVDPNGMLGEMKGRSNDKPAERYHPDIIILLRSEYVDGIKGGGYRPENNFSLDDLDPDVAAQLLEEKPLLGGFYEMYRKVGMTPEIRGYLNDALEGKGIETPDAYLPEQKIFVLDEWRDVGQFLSNIDDTNMEKLYDIATGQDEYAATGDASKIFIDMIHELPASWQDEALQHAHMEGERDPHRLEAAARYLINNRDPWYEMFEDVIHDAHSREDIAWERLEQYHEVGWQFTSGYAYTNIPHKQPLKDFLASNPKIQLLIHERDLVGIATADDDGDEYGYEQYELAHKGWSSLSDNNDEHLREAGLIDGHGKDKWLEQDDPESNIEYVQKFMAAVKGFHRSSTISDPRQTALSFESVERIRQLAGLRQV